MDSISSHEHFEGNDRILFGIMFGVLAFWLFTQTTLNIAPVMAGVRGTLRRYVLKA